MSPERTLIGWVGLVLALWLAVCAGAWVRSHPEAIAAAVSYLRSIRPPP